MKTLSLKFKLLAIIVMAMLYSNANSQSKEIAESKNIHEKFIEFFGVERITKTNNSLKIAINSDNIFEPNSSILKQNLSNEITNIIFILKRYKRYPFKVLVHTSAEGADDINLSISQQRAESLSKYLTDNNIKSKRFVCLGMGESQSKQNSNNRIEFIISYTGM